MRTPRGTWLVRTPPLVDADLTGVSRRDLHGILTASAPPVQFATVSEAPGTVQDATVVLDTGETRIFDLVVAPMAGGRVYWFATITAPPNWPLTDELADRDALRRSRTAAFA